MDSLRYSFLTPNTITHKYDLDDMSDSFRWLVQLFASLIEVDTENLCLAIHDVELLVIKAPDWLRRTNRRGVISNWGCQE